MKCDQSKCPTGERHRCFLQAQGWPQDYHCINGVAMDIDEWSEGFDEDEVRPLAPCHPGYCGGCMGTGTVGEGFDCPKCEGTGNTLGKNDSIQRLANVVANCVNSCPNLNSGEE